jgi:transcriptional regulator with XRE-family HTH domain
MINADYAENEGEIADQIKHISKRLREEREKQRISQINLAFKAGLSQNQINYIETGKRTPTLYTLLRICNALQISPAILFDVQDKDKQEAREKIIQLITKFM